MIKESPKVVVKYETLSALYASQSIVNATGDEVIVDFASGPIPGNGEQVLPIHTRIAMSPAAAKRLADLLLRACGEAGQDEARLPGLR